MYITNDWEFSTEWGPVVWKIGGAKFHQSMPKGSTKINTSLSLNLSKYFVHQLKRQNKHFLQVEFNQRILKSGEERGNCKPYTPPPPTHTPRGSSLVAPTQYDDINDKLQLNEKYPHPKES